MTLPLDESAVPELTTQAVSALATIGICTVEDLAHADADQIALVEGIPPEQARRLVELAGDLLRDQQLAPHEPPQDVIPFHHYPPSAEHLSRGLRAARAIEHTTGLVRKARSKAGRRPPRKARWSHKRARRQLKKLRRTLESMQRNVLAQGLSEPRLERLLSALSRLDTRLDALASEIVDRELLRGMRKVAKRARKDLQAL